MEAIYAELLVRLVPALLDLAARAYGRWLTHKERMAALPIHSESQEAPTPPTSGA